MSVSIDITVYTVYTIISVIFHPNSILGLSRPSLTLTMILCNGIKQAPRSGHSKSLISRHCFYNLIICKPYKAHIDQDNKIVTTAAYMCETAVHEIHDGVAKMVNEVIKLC